MDQLRAQETETCHPTLCSNHQGSHRDPARGQDKAGTSTHPPGCPAPGSRSLDPTLPPSSLAQRRDPRDLGGLARATHQRGQLGEPIAQPQATAGLEPLLGRDLGARKWEKAACVGSLGLEQVTKSANVLQPPGRGRAGGAPDRLEWPRASLPTEEKGPALLALRGVPGHLDPWGSQERNWVGPTPGGWGATGPTDLG